MINYLVNGPLIPALGWTLIHSLWLAIIVSLLIRVSWNFISAGKAQLRYRMAWAGMLLIIVGCALIFRHNFLEYNNDYLAALEAVEIATANLDLNSDSNIEITPAVEVGEELPLSTSFLNFLESNMPYLVLAWFFGAFIMGFRLMGSWLYLRNLGIRGIQKPTEEWNLLFSDLCTKMGHSRPVKFYLSNRVNEPITLKHLKPIVLFPIGLLSQLSTEQVEIIILHELAHIKRWDYLLNWVQSLIELVFFYHPAVWWLSNQIREAREHCCDDLVLNAGKQKRMLYARTLAQVSAYSLNSKSHLAMSLNGNNNSFTFRIKRMFGQFDQALDWRKPLLSVMMIVFVLLIGFFNAPVLVAEDMPQEQLQTPVFDLPDIVVTAYVPETPALEPELAPRNFGVIQPLEGGIKETAVYWGDHLKDLKVLIGPVDNDPIYILDGKRVSKAEIDKLNPDEIESVTVIKGEQALEKYGEEGKYGAVIIQSKAAAKTIENPIHILDGVKVTKERVKEINPEDIANINILKGEAAFKKFGEDGKNGVVEITTKLKDASKGAAANTDLSNVKIRGIVGDLTPLYIVNGKVWDKEGKSPMDELKSEDIDHINVIKGKSATTLYKEAGKNGVVQIFTKNKGTGFKEVEKVEKVENKTIQLGKLLNDKQPLFVVDGKKLRPAEGETMELNPDDIKSINVLKGEAALKKYGDEGKNGVVEVTTKNAKKDKGFGTAVDIPDDNAHFADYRFKLTQGKETIPVDPLIVLDGKPLGPHSKVARKLDKSTFKTFEFRSPSKDLISKYGKEAKQGALILSNYKEKPLPQDQSALPFVPHKSKTIETPVNKFHPIAEWGNSTLAESVFKYGLKGQEKKCNPLIVVDDKIMGKQSKVGHLVKVQVPGKGIMLFSPPSNYTLEKYGKQAKNGVVNVITKTGEFGIREKSQVQGPATQIVTGNVKTTGLSSGMDLGKKTYAEATFLFGPTGKMKKMNPLLVVNGVPKGRQKQAGAGIKVSESQFVVFKAPKNKDNILKYGESAKEGVVFIQDEEFAFGKAKIDKDLNGVTEKANPKIDTYTTFIDGKKAGLWQEAKGKLDKGNIVKVDVYGEDYVPAKYANVPGGVVIVETKKVVEGRLKRSPFISFTAKGNTKMLKKGADPKDALNLVGTNIKLQNFKAYNEKESHITLTSEEGFDIKTLFEKGDDFPLIELDGKVIAPNDRRLKNISAAKVHTVEIIDGGAQLRQMGESAKYGVVRIYTQNGSKKAPIDAVKVTPKEVATSKLALTLKQSIKVFPNPFDANTRVQFTLPEGGNTEVSVYDYQGKLVKVIHNGNLDAGPQEITWKSENAPSGNYNLMIKTKGAVVATPIVKQ